ncbi:unnamed protein product [Prorocentrum cordatum]|uniref:Uncharacterized protein n=1 Tax=Prorocentrum cordatum TaxID=2364126 RepID=A0ABN9XVE1_9DINO|nr:unnamed protein product [Polarella glacialis]
MPTGAGLLSLDWQSCTQTAPHSLQCTEEEGEEKEEEEEEEEGRRRKEESDDTCVCDVHGLWQPHLQILRYTQAFARNIHWMDALPRGGMAIVAPSRVLYIVSFNILRPRTDR